MSAGAGSEPSRHRTVVEWEWSGDQLETAIRFLQIRVPNRLSPTRPVSTGIWGSASVLSSSDGSGPLDAHARVLSTRPESSGIIPPKSENVKASDPPVVSLPDYYSGPSALGRAGTVSPSEGWQSNAESGVPGFVYSYSTSPSDHGNTYIQAITHGTHIRHFDGAAAGWLISASKGLINLWRCCEPGASGGPALQLSHSHATDYRVLTLDWMDSSQGEDLLIATASLAAGGKGNGVVLLSVDGEELFQERGRIERLRGEDATQGVSLAGCGGPLRSSVAVAAGKGFAIFDLSSSLARPRAFVDAHQDRVSLLRVNPFGISLFSGCVDGTVSLWDMRKPPRASALQLLAHTRVVTGLDVLDSTTVVSGSADTTALVWDLRKYKQPVHTCNPDGGSVLCVRASPRQDEVVLSTLKALYLLSRPSWSLTTLSDPMMENTYPDACWNQQAVGYGKYIYACTLQGKIDVFCRSGVS